MKYSKLGNTDIDVSRVCLGTMTFGEQNNESEAHEQLDFAIDNGVNFIDTAELYAVPSTKNNNGLTEKYIGSWIAKGNRQKIILATKVTGPSANLTYISENLGFSKARIIEAVENSLTNLQTDYIDLYQLHWPERNTNCFGRRGYVHKEEEQWQDNFAEVMMTLSELVSQGKIRAWGLSNESPWGVMKSMEYSSDKRLSRPVSIQNPYSLLNRTYEIGLAEISMRENIGLLAYSPMAFGLLSGKYHEGHDQPNDRLNLFSQMSRYNSEQSYAATKAYLEISKKHGLSLAKMSLAFINHQKFVDSIIIGATSLMQLKENIESAEIVLSDEILLEIERVHESIPNPAP